MLTYNGHVNTINLLLKLSKYFSKLQLTVNMYMHMTNIIKQCYIASYRMKNVHIMEIQYKRYKRNLQSFNNIWFTENCKSTVVKIYQLNKYDIDKLNMKAPSVIKKYDTV